MLNRLKKVKSFAEFIIDILEEETSDEKFYAYISRYSKNSPTWYLFIACDDVDGNRHFRGKYALKCIEMEEIVNLFSVFANYGRNIIVDTEGYFINKYSVKEVEYGSKNYRKNHV